MNATEHLWWEVNIGSGYDLLPSGNKPSAEPMITQIYVAIWCHWAIMYMHIVLYCSVDGLVQERRNSIATHWSYVFLTLTHLCIIYDDARIFYVIFQSYNTASLYWDCILKFQFSE